MNDYWLALLLGVVEGLTEFLPISSTGHMLLVENGLGMELDKDPFWKMFTVVIQLGAILAVVVFYARRLRDLVVDFFAAQSNPDLFKGRTVPRWRHPLILVLAAVIPAGLIGVLAKKKIDLLMEHALPIGIALFVGGLLIALIEWLRKGRDRTFDVAEVSPFQAGIIGAAQAAALIPGMSRSACTIMGGRMVGLNTPAAADFSFLLSIPTMMAATGYSLTKYLLNESTAPLDLHQWLVLATGFVTSFVVALLVVAWFLSYLRKHGLRLFVVYRLILGLAVIVAAFAGWLK